MTPEFLGISVPASKCGIQSVPLEELKHIWTKAENILRDVSSIVVCPGYQRGFAVASSHDPSKPHVVTPLASGEIKCTGCPQFNRLSICSHSIAIAEKTSSLRKFLSWYTNKKPKPNFSQAANQGMPNGRGKKGEHIPRRQKSKRSSSVLPTHYVDRINTTSPCTEIVSTNVATVSTVQQSGTVFHLLPSPNQPVSAIALTTQNPLRVSNTIGTHQMQTTQCTPQMQTTTGTHQMQTTAGTRQMQTTAGTRQMQTTAGTHQMQTTAGTHQMQTTAGTRQMQTTAGTCQMQTTAGTHQMQTTAGTRQMQTTAGTRQMQTTTGTRQMQTTAGTRQMQTTAGTPQMQTTAGTRQMQTTAGTPQMQTTAGTRQMQTTAGTPQMQTTTGTRQMQTTAGTHRMQTTAGTRQMQGTHQMQTAQGTSLGINMHYPMYDIQGTAPLNSTHGLNSIHPFPAIWQPAPQFTSSNFPFNTQPYHNQNPFILQFQHGNIRKCAGCGSGIAKQPDTLILKHMERYQYPTGDPYQPVAFTLRKERPSYYHAIQICVLKRHPHFQPASMVDYSEVQNVLSEAHKMKLLADLHLILP